MSKNARQQSKSNKSQLKSHHKWKTIVIVGLLLCFGLTSMIIAQWRATRVASKANTMLASAAPLPTPDLSPSNPSKEYIYAGGRLIATEEPVTTSSSSRINVALAANGGQASASTTLTYNGNPFPASRAIDGDRRGLNYMTGGVWQSSSASLPQWLQVDFNGSKIIDEINVFSLQNDYSSPIAPTEELTFSYYGLTGFEVQYWDGSGWVNVPGGNITGNNKVWKKLTFSPVTTTKIRVLTNATSDGHSRITELEAWGTAGAPSTNVALASNGGQASASSEYAGGGYSAGNAINGDRPGTNLGTSGSWNDAAPANTFPDWLQVQFDGTKAIHEIDLFSVQDNYTNPSIPNESTTFTLYGLTGFDVQYWTGSAWATVPNGSVTGNNYVWRKFTFPTITTTKIRVLTNASPDGYSRVTELEAWGYDAPQSETNVALSSNGATASASSEYAGGGYSAGNANNGDRPGTNPGATGSWNDAGPANTFPDWLQIDFSAQKTIKRIELFMLQDTYWAPLEPTTSMEFLYYGLRDFQVQYWTGSAWTDVPGGNVTNNNKVWRTFTFPDITTSKIRVYVTGSPDGWSRLTELEA